MSEEKTAKLAQRIEEAAAQRATMILSADEAQAVAEVLAAAKCMFEPTIDRNVGRRRMKRLQMALARLEAR